MVFNWRPGRLSGSDRKIALRWDGITAHNTFCASTQRYHESATSTGSTGGSDDVSRMSWGARCQCLLTLSHMSRLRRVGVVGHFPSKLQFFLTVHKRGYVNVTHQGRHRGDTARLLFYICGSTTGDFECVGPPLRPRKHHDLYAKSCVHLVMTVHCVPPPCTSGLDWRGARQRVWLAAWQQTRVLAEGGGIKPPIWIRLAGVGLEVGGTHKD